MSLLQIYQWVCQWKNFENRLTFREVMGKSLVSCFFWDTVYNDARLNTADRRIAELITTDICDEFTENSQ